MPVVIGIPRETAAGERRVAAVPDVVKKLTALGAEVVIESGAGAGAFFGDDQFTGATFVGSAQEVYSRANVVLKVRPPSVEEINALQPGA
ncbi:MAG: NAD(P)(+) transhydrogenase (Re/Si-specific) subunit alpha, partial [Rhodocyclaceae bacterium]